jgi:hypothetical protein
MWNIDINHHTESLITEFLWSKCDLDHNPGRPVLLASWLRPPAGQAPSHAYEAQGLPGEVRGQYEEPCGKISGPDPATQLGVEMAEAATAVITEDRFSDQVDGDGEKHQSKEQESQQLGCLPDNYPANLIAGLCHGEFRYRQGPILAQGL